MYRYSKGKGWIPDSGPDLRIIHISESSVGKTVIPFGSLQSALDDMLDLGAVYCSMRVSEEDLSDPSLWAIVKAEDL